MSIQLHDSRLVRMNKLQASPLQVAKKRRHSNMIGEGLSEVNFMGLPTINFTEDVGAGQPELPIKTYRSRQIEAGQNKKVGKVEKNSPFRSNSSQLKTVRIKVMEQRAELNSSSKSKAKVQTREAQSKTPVQMVGDFEWRKGDIAQKRYEFKDILGRGTFGTVFKGYDHTKKEDIAIKVIRNDSQCNEMAETQISLLVMIREKDSKDQRSIVRIKDFFTFRNHICIVTELLSVNLFDMLRKTHFKGMNVEIIRKVAIQLMTSLAFLKSLRIIHGDIKPENIVLKEFNKTGIKLIDFGTSILADDRHYDYLMSRYYRAPEVIMGAPYNEKIDMWSAGCVLAELYNGRPLFPGDCQKQQVIYFLEAVGLPEPSFLRVSTRRNHYFTSEGEPLASMISNDDPVKPLSKPLSSMITDVGFCSFLKKLLVLDPTQRISADEALMDPWIIQGFPSELLPEHIKNVKVLKQAIRQSSKPKNYSKFHRRGSSDGPR